MIPEDRRRALARTRAARQADTRRSVAEQMVVLATGAAALLLFLVM